MEKGILNMVAAEARVIREGFFKWIDKGTTFDVSCTTTFLEDGGKKIIVDTPNVGEEDEFLSALEKAKIDRLDIDYVVVTHSHPDHVGCLHLFPNAEYVSARSRWRGERHVYWKEEALPLTDDVYVLKTPGHTSDSCSVIANTKKGVVAVVGDMWVRVDDPRLLVVSDEKQLLENRQKIVSLADYIIPGHGEMLPVAKAKF